MRLLEKSIQLNIPNMNEIENIFVNNNTSIPTNRNILPFDHNNFSNQQINPLIPPNLNISYEVNDQNPSINNDYNKFLGSYQNSQNYDVSEPNNSYINPSQFNVQRIF